MLYCKHEMIFIMATNLTVNEESNGVAYGCSVYVYMDIVFYWNKSQ